MSSRNICVAALGLKSHLSQLPRQSSRKWKAPAVLLVVLETGWIDIALHPQRHWNTGLLPTMLLAMMWTHCLCHDNMQCVGTMLLSFALILFSR